MGRGGRRGEGGGGGSVREGRVEGEGQRGHTTTGTTSSNCQSRVSPDQFILWSSDYAAHWCNSLDNTVYRYSVIANSWDNSTTGQSRRLHLDWETVLKLPASLLLI